MLDTRLVLVDFQRDFCLPTGSLYVTGANEDAQRVATLIDRIGSKLNDISCTLDSHHRVHIGNKIWWKDKKGNHPNPFTTITVEDVENGTWRATKPSLQAYSLKYVKALRANGRYTLTVWPFHTLIGTEGQCLHPAIEKSLAEWADKYFAYPNYVTKGSNILTEHYSAIEADVPDPQDPSTQINTQFVNNLAEADILLFAGEASSHCLKSTLESVVNNFADPTYAKKIKLLKDGTSPVSGFEAKQDELFAFCKKHDIEVLNSTEILL